jgi:hypothetical protein
MKKIENTFAVTGFVGKDASIREFENASVTRFSLAIRKGEKDKDGKTQYTSAFMSIEDTLLICAKFEQFQIYLYAIIQNETT